MRIIENRQTRIALNPAKNALFLLNPKKYTAIHKHALRLVLDWAFFGPDLFLYEKTPSKRMCSVLLLEGVSGFVSKIECRCFSHP